MIAVSGSFGRRSGKNEQHDRRVELTEPMSLSNVNPRLPSVSQGNFDTTFVRRSQQQTGDARHLDENSCRHQATLNMDSDRGNVPKNSMPI